MIYTTYFAHLRKVDPAIIPYNISLWAPKGYIGRSCNYLFPTKAILDHWKLWHDPEAYAREYGIAVLSKLDPNAVVKQINAETRGREFAFVCYEKTGDFCHRYLVAQWLINAGYEVKELD